MKIIDISRSLKTAPLYPGSEEVRAEKIMDMDKGDEYNLSLITADSHTGTHADAFSHYIKGGTTIDKMELDRYYGKCRVVTVPKNMPIFKNDLEGLIENTERLILRTGQGYLTKDAAEYLVSCGIKTVATDYWSIGPLDNEEEIHKIILGSGIAVIENLILDNVEDGEYILCAFPIKIDNCDGGFVRAVLIKE